MVKYNCPTCGHKCVYLWDEIHSKPVDPVCVSGKGCIYPDWNCKAQIKGGN